MIYGQLSIVHSWLSTIAGQVLMNLNYQYLTVHILIIQKFGWPTIGEQLLTVCNWVSVIDGSGPSWFDSLNLDGQLLTVYCWPPTSNDDGLTNLGHQQMDYVWRNSSGLCKKCWIIFQNSVLKQRKVKCSQTWDYMSVLGSLDNV